TANMVIDNNWQSNAKLIVMPGGADLPYVKKLQGKGNENIRNFVNNGGSYLGICAGAYYGSSSIEFDKGGTLEVTGPRELQFFSGKAIGPVLATYDYKTHSGSRAAHITSSYEQIPHTNTYYNGGGYFAEPEQYENTAVIARYDNNLAAIIKVQFGNGKVLLSGVHFEYNPALLDNTDEYLKNIIPELTKTQHSRTLLISRLLQELNI